MEGSVDQMALELALTEYQKAQRALTAALERLTIYLELPPPVSDIQRKSASSEQASSHSGIGSGTRSAA